MPPRRRRPWSSCPRSEPRRASARADRYHRRAASQRRASARRPRRIAAASQSGAVTGFPLDTSFRPRRWLRGPAFPDHSLQPAAAPRARGAARDPVRAASEELLLECGDGVTLQAFHASPRSAAANPANVSRCCCTAGKAAPTPRTCCRCRRPCSTLGFEVVRLNLRDHGATHHLEPRPVPFLPAARSGRRGARARETVRRHADGARRVFAGRQFHAARAPPHREGARPADRSG